MITEHSAGLHGMSMREACALAWLFHAEADILDYPKAVAMGAQELAEWLNPEEVRDLDAERKVFEGMIASQSEASQEYNRGKL